MKIPAGKLVAVDTEATGLRPRHGHQPFGVSWCNEDMETGWVQWEVDTKTRRVKIPKADKRELEKWLGDDEIVKVMWNSSFDVGMFLDGLEMDIPSLERGEAIEDAQVAFHVMITSEETQALKKLCKKYGIMGDEDEKSLQADVIKMRNKAKALGWSVGPKTQTDYWILKQLDPKNNKCEIYGVKDAVRTMKAWKIAIKELAKNDRIFIYEWEMEKLWPLLLKMERRGIRVSLKIIKDEIQNCEQEKHVRLGFLEEAASGAINPGSDVQMRKLLFGKLKLKPVQFTAKTRQPSVASEALQPYKNVGAVKHLLEYRSYEKGITSFFGVYDRARVKDKEGTWVIYPNFRQAGKKTARLSCTDPNLQGVTDSEGGRAESKIPARKPFIPRKGKVILSIDYNQLEVRTFAAASRYKTLIDILLSGRDLHTEATNGIWGEHGSRRAINAGMAALGTDDERKVIRWLEGFRLEDGNWNIVAAEKSKNLKTSRSKGKPFFFTRMFGGGKMSISEKLGIDLEEAQELVDRYDETLPGVIAFVRRMEEVGRKQGYVMTLYGRCLDLVSGEEYKASPYIVQGTAADLVKRAMVNADQLITGSNMMAEILLQIHDELLVEVSTEEEAGAVLKIVEVMEAQGEVIGLVTPCSIKVVDKNWAEPRSKFTIQGSDPLEVRKAMVAYPEKPLRWFLGT